MTPDYVIDEMQRGGKTFRRKKLYRVMIRYVAPVMMLVLFCSPPGSLLKSYSSMYQDINLCIPMEIDAIEGAYKYRKD
mgnify:CR=1 FL=1